MTSRPVVREDEDARGVSPTPQLLRPRIMQDAWGSHSVIAELTGRPTPSAQPESELWMGAHESAPCGIGNTTLDRLIAADPEGQLGPDVAAGFAGRLPFLLKVLAARTALSIQVHPNATQALDAPPGTYVDDWPKPEALVAITPFEIFAGLRPYDELCRLLATVPTPRLSELARSAACAANPMSGLLAAVLRSSRADRSALLQEVLSVGRDGVPHEYAGALEAVHRVAEQFPADIGPVILLLMTHRVLQPGEYIFVPPGVLHSYVRGTCVEVLANSDNIVRAGLTPKPLNIDELLRIVDADREVVPERHTDGRVHSFPADVPHFELHVVTGGSDPVELPTGRGPRIALALHDSVSVHSAGQSLELGAGQSCYLPAGCERTTARGDGTVFLVTCSLPAR